MLTYCVALWGSSFKNVLWVAQVLQNDAIRAIKGLPRKASVSTWYSKFKILKIDGVTTHRQGALAFKVFNEIIPPDGPFDFTTRPARSQRLKGKFRVPRVKLTLTTHSLYYRLPTVWNDLPDTLKSSVTIGGFKTKFTELLLQELRSQD